MAESELEPVIERYHRALRAFGRGDPGPVKTLFSGNDDVTLANPFGPALRGRAAVEKALDYASSRFRDGDVDSFERLATHSTPDLAAVLEVERWRAKVGGSDEISPFQLRVTSVFRRENGAWTLVHRHGDPIATPDPQGPLRRG